MLRTWESVSQVVRQFSRSYLTYVRDNLIGSERTAQTPSSCLDEAAARFREGSASDEAPDIESLQKSGSNENDKGAVR